MTNLTAMPPNANKKPPSNGGMPSLSLKWLKKPERSLSDEIKFNCWVVRKSDKRDKNDILIFE